MSLTIEGLTSFREPQEIDFSPLDLFVITGPTGAGHLTVYAADLAQPQSTSTLNFVTGLTRANNAIVLLSNDGKIKLRPFVTGSGSVHILVDVSGFFIEP